MKTDDIIKQLEALSPKELRRVSYATKEKLCVEEPCPPGVFPNWASIAGFQGMLMDIQLKHEWEQEKKLPLTEPKP